MQKALGLIETIGLVSAIEAADAAVKAANIVLLGYENTKGGGKIMIKFVGDVGAVQAAVAAGVAAANRIGKVYGSHVIPRPHDEIAALIYQNQQAQQPAAPITAPDAAPEPETATPDDLAAEAPAADSPAHAQCAAITKSGERCTLTARPGLKYCNIHRKQEQSAG